MLSCHKLQLIHLSVLLLVIFITYMHNYWLQLYSFVHCPSKNLTQVIVIFILIIIVIIIMSLLHFILLLEKVISVAFCLLNTAVLCSLSGGECSFLKLAWTLSTPS